MTCTLNWATLAPMDLFSATILLFLIMDPLGNVPLFLTILKNVPARRRQWIIAREMLIALITLLLLLYFGHNVLQLLGLRAESISVAGGIILFLIAIKMLFPAARAHYEDDEIDGEPLVVPLAIPLVAGPSILAALLLMVSREPDRMLDWTLALVLAWAASALILFASPLLLRLLGRRGLVAIERLMGMLLVAMAVQMFLDGVAAYLA